MITRKTFNANIKCNYIQNYINSIVNTQEDHLLSKFVLEWFSQEKMNSDDIELLYLISKKLRLDIKSILVAILYMKQFTKDQCNDIIKSKYGIKVSEILSGLKKIKYDYTKTQLRQILNPKHLYITLIDDIRIILIKIAIQVIQMRSSHTKTKIEKTKTTLETKYVYLPIIHKLGLYDIKSELEDICLKYLYPNIYFSITKKINCKKSKREYLLNKLIERIKRVLEEKKYKFKIVKRVKSITSIWNKIQKRGIPYNRIYDTLGFRIVLQTKTSISKEKKMCWEVYDIVKRLYKIKKDRTRDWLSKPKENGYEALHITVRGLEYQWGEIQIRTTRMDELAEKGSAMHWKYKNEGNILKIPGIESWFESIKQIIEKNKIHLLDTEYTEKIKLYKNDICIFIDGDKVVKVPNNLTLLDICFLLYKEKALKFIGGKLNHKLATLDQLVRCGDQVKTFFGDANEANSQWLLIAKTEYAKNIILEFLNMNNKTKKQLKYNYN